MALPISILVPLLASGLAGALMLLSLAMVREAIQRSKRRIARQSRQARRQLRHTQCCSGSQTLSGIAV